jgi:hypothetical protein
MLRMPEDPDRDERITMEIVVDAYDRDERIMGWYYYLADTLNFPFTTTCREKHLRSPLKVGDKVNIIGMAELDDRNADMAVTIDWKGDALAIPLSQLDATTEDAATQQAIEDWHYWIDQGYEF